ncbi:MAG: hypothetical protein M0Z50_15650 [Planctomycetia bacterium]|nr:hypothetical protein [Planctomycetia bacterium]
MPKPRTFSVVCSLCRRKTPHYLWRDRRWVCRDCVRQLNTEPLQDSKLVSGGQGHRLREEDIAECLLAIGFGCLILAIVLMGMMAAAVW